MNKESSVSIKRPNDSLNQISKKIKIEDENTEKPSRCLYVFDKNSRNKFLVDTGCTESLVPLSFKDKYPVMASESVTYFGYKQFLVRVCGKVRLELDFGLKQRFEWVFLIGSVEDSILGADFIFHYSLQVDLRKGTLLESNTSGNNNSSTLMKSPSVVNRDSTVQTPRKWLKLGWALRRCREVEVFGDSVGLQTCIDHSTLSCRVVSKPRYIFPSSSQDYQSVPGSSKKLRTPWGDKEIDDSYSKMKEGALQLDLTPELRSRFNETIATKCDKEVMTPRRLIKQGWAVPKCPEIVIIHTNTRSTQTLIPDRQPIRLGPLKNADIKYNTNRGLRSRFYDESFPRSFQLDLNTSKKPASSLSPNYTPLAGNAASSRSYHQTHEAAYDYNTTSRSNLFLSTPYMLESSDDDLPEDYLVIDEDISGSDTE